MPVNECIHMSVCVCVCVRVPRVHPSISENGLCVCMQSWHMINSVAVNTGVEVSFRMIHFPPAESQHCKGQILW